MALGDELVVGAMPNRWEFLGTVVVGTVAAPSTTACLSMTMRSDPSQPPLFPPKSSHEASSLSLNTPSRGWSWMTAVEETSVKIRQAAAGSLLCDTASSTWESQLSSKTTMEANHRWLSLSHWTRGSDGS